MNENFQQNYFRSSGQAWLKLPLETSNLTTVENSIFNSFDLFPKQSPDSWITNTIELNFQQLASLFFPVLVHAELQASTGLKAPQEPKTMLPYGLPLGLLQRGLGIINNNQMDVKQNKYLNHQFWRNCSLSMILTSLQAPSVTTQPTSSSLFCSSGLVLRLLRVFFFFRMRAVTQSIMSSGFSELLLSCSFWWWLRHCSDVRWGSSLDSRLNTFLDLRRYSSSKSSLFSDRNLMQISFSSWFHKPACLVETSFILSKAFLFLLCSLESTIRTCSSSELGMKSESEFSFILSFNIYIVIDHSQSIEQKV